MKILLCISFLVLLCYCKQKTATSTHPAKKDTTDFFQVVQYIQGQVNEVNKTPYYIYKLEISGSVKDSTTLDNAGFNKLARQFIQPDINDPALKKYYNENIFHDQTTQSFTISYSTANKNLVIQNIDILLNEDGKTVKRVFIRKFYNHTDSSVIEQLSWKAERSFQIIRLIQKPTEEASRQTIVVWNEQ